MKPIDVSASARVECITRGVTAPATTPFAVDATTA